MASIGGLVGAIFDATPDWRVRIAMIVGALLESGKLTGPYPQNTGGAPAYGPYQIYLPANSQDGSANGPRVTVAQANDEVWATKYMLPRYQAAVNAQDWSNPQTATLNAVIAAEGPGQDSYYSQQGVHGTIFQAAYATAVGLVNGVSAGQTGSIPVLSGIGNAVGGVISGVTNIPGTIAGAAGNAVGGLFGGAGSWIVGHEMQLLIGILGAGLVIFGLIGLVGATNDASGGAGATVAKAAVLA